MPKFVQTKISNRLSRSLALPLALLQSSPIPCGSGTATLDTPREDHSKGLETAANEAASPAVVAFQVIQNSTATAPDAMQLERQPSVPDMSSCRMGNSLQRASGPAS